MHLTTRGAGDKDPWGLSIALTSFVLLFFFSLLHTLVCTAVGQNDIGLLFGENTHVALKLRCIVSGPMGRPHKQQSLRMSVVVYCVCILIK